MSDNSIIKEIEEKLNYAITKLNDDSERIFAYKRDLDRRSADERPVRIYIIGDNEIYDMIYDVIMDDSRMVAMISHLPIIEVIDELAHQRSEMSENDGIEIDSYVAKELYILEYQPLDSPADNLAEIEDYLESEPDDNSIADVALKMIYNHKYEIWINLNDQLVQSLERLREIVISSYQ